ncbi:MAG: type 1 glutamine amidotransferase [Pseudomonadales bacterium]|nr:type 1 glutamine amidotransferase [Pseudomonadales bacterium]
MTEKARDQLKTLLIQIRDKPNVRKEEHDSFCAFSGLRPEQIEIFNVFDQPHFDPSIADNYDGVFVGGASEASVLEKERFPFVDNSIELMRYCIDQSIPVFASCFGFQLAILALHGTIDTDQHGFEMGTLPISLTPDAKQDILYHDTPDPFMAVSVHREKAVIAPEGCIALANTDVCNHSFKVSGKPFWAFQFHPEVDKRVLIERLTVFKNEYTDGDDHLNEVLNNAVETPESNELLRKFVDRVLLRKCRKTP